ncbi:ATP-binding cassette domain-containing protein [Magnetococcales bacterium HHB-1]
MILQTKALTLRHKNRHLFSERDLQLMPGQILSIWSEEISDANLWLHAFAQGEKEQGQIFLAGETYHGLSKAKGRALLLSQEDNLAQLLTIWENLALPLEYHNILPTKQIKTELHKIAEERQITDCLFHFPQELTDNQRQQVVLARALLMKPKLLLLESHLPSDMIEQLEHFCKIQQSAIIIVREKPPSQADACAILYRENPDNRGDA